MLSILRWPIGTSVQASRECIPTCYRLLEFSLTDKLSVQTCINPFANYHLNGLSQIIAALSCCHHFQHSCLACVHALVVWDSALVAPSSVSSSTAVVMLALVSCIHTFINHTCGREFGQLHGCRPQQNISATNASSGA